MVERWNVQINIQAVEVSDTEAAATHQIRRPATDRHITEVLKLAITADSEEEAYSKAHRMLNANAPGNVVPWEQPAKQHLHRASCHGSAGELQCGYPANGPTI